MHLGHAYSALLNYELAKQTGGKFLVRIEDIDQERCTPQNETRMLEDLLWLGLEWEEPPTRQSTRFDCYKHTLRSLEKRGLIYPSFMSRADVKAFGKANPDWLRDPDGALIYPGQERDWSEAQRQAELKKGTPANWRLDMCKALADLPISNAEAWGDVVLARKDTPTSYHLAVVVDDAAQHVTHIVRGMDIKPATELHKLLQKLLELPEPTYVHHRLVLDNDGKKLSKSRQSLSIAALRSEGYTPQNIKKMIDWDDAEVETIIRSWSQAET